MGAETRIHSGVGRQHRRHIDSREIGRDRRATNETWTAPHPEMGGYGATADDRGIHFYYDWVHDHLGRWEYPKHIRNN
jgi:hypothetical protein